MQKSYSHRGHLSKKIATQKNALSETTQLQSGGFAVARCVVWLDHGRVIILSPGRRTPKKREDDPAIYAQPQQMAVSSRSKARDCD
jgi:hypothetical protein